MTFTSNMFIFSLCEINVAKVILWIDRWEEQTLSS